MESNFHDQKSICSAGFSNRLCSNISKMPCKGDYRQKLISSGDWKRGNPQKIK